MADVILVGAGGLAREVMASLAVSRQHAVLGLLDDNPARTGQEVHEVPVLGPVRYAAQLPGQLLVCVGSGQARRAVVDQLTALGVGAERYATVVDPSVTVSTGSTIGPGCILLAQVVLTTDVSLGSHVVVMPHVTFTHDNQVLDYATVCAGVTLGGGVRVGAAAYLGMRAAVRHNLTIGADAVLGMGAVLLDNLPAGETWVGCPATALRQAQDTTPRQAQDTSMQEIA